MSKMLIFIGTFLVMLGLLWPLLSKLALGKLPGDILIEKGNFKLYAPIATSLALSVVLSLILWLLRKL